MKRKILFLSQILIAGLIHLTTVQSTSITSTSYDAGYNVLTIAFSDSIYTNNILLGRMTFDDDNGGPKPDVLFSGGTILNEGSHSDTLQISLIYGGIIDQWENRNIWGNDLSLVNAIEALDLSSLKLVIEEGTFIRDNAEPFEDTDGNGVYSPVEQFTDLNDNGIWDGAEEFIDLNGNSTWDDAEQFTDLNDNGIWDGAEEFTDCGVNNNGVYICDDDSGWNESFGNGVCDGVESFEDGYFLFPEDGFWNFNDNNGNGVCDNAGPPPLWECEPFIDVEPLNGLCDQEFDSDGDGIWFTGEELSDLNGNSTWDDAEEFTDLNGDSLWTPAEPLVDFDSDNEFDEVSEEFTDLNDNGIWDQYEPNSFISIDVLVSGQNVSPILSSANYDANVNVLTLVFDKLVQFDQIPEDETFPPGQNRPGNGNLDSGEDRNGNGVLDKETNINIFKVGFADNIGSTKTLEGLGSLVQTADSDTMEILLTRNDSKSLETMLDISLMNVNLSEGAFMDTLYNPSEMSTLPITSTLDSLPLLADSAIYNISENSLFIFFRSKETNKRRVVVTPPYPAPVYSKISLSVGDVSMNLSGINGTPFASPSDIFLRIGQLILSDQKELEMLIDEMDTEGALSLTIDEYAVYDENNNGNLQVVDLPVTIISLSDFDKQPPQIIPSGLVYDADTDILTLPWDMEVGFFNEVPIPERSEVSGNSNLEGFALFDGSEDSLITFGQGEIYYLTARDTTFIKLSEADAELLENYPNRSTLTFTIDPFTFYSAGTYNNGNKAVTKDSLFSVHYSIDESAPKVNEVLFNVADSTLTITLDELVMVDLLYPEKLAFGGIEIDGEIVVDSGAQFVSNFSVKVFSDTYDDIISLDDDVKISPLFQSADSAFVNADSAFSGWIDWKANYGRKFWIQSFEAFPPAPVLVFASLRSVGINCEIYVDEQAWKTKIDSADLVAIITAFDETAPNDSSKGIADALREFLGGGEKDTDNNGKISFVFTDIFDEYGKGRNDTKSSLYVHGYSTILDTLDGAPYSNHGDIIYLDTDPMSLNADDQDLRATYNALVQEHARMIMQHNQPDQENWIIEGVSAVLQKKMAGDVKFFGRSTAPAITAGNQLTYIATGYQSLKGRKDKWNVYLFLSYLQEKYSISGTGWDIIQAIARSDSVGIKAVSDALVTLDINIDIKDIFSDYGMACYLDAVQSDSMYNSRYSFDGFDLQTPPSGKPAVLLSWDASIGKESPYTKKDILPWSYNYLIMRGYSFDVDNNFNSYLSPDLDNEDSLVFNGYDGISFRMKKLTLKSGFMDPMNTDYEVYDFELDEQTSYGTLPVTTDPLFTFRDTLDNALYGVQNIILMIAKTDDAQPPATYDFAVSNIVSVPDFSDLFAYQNPGIQNFLDVYVVSQRRVFDQLGNEEPIVEYSVNTGDSGSIVLSELTSYGSDLVIYHTSKELTLEGSYNFTYQGIDQSGNLFERDSLTIVVDYYDPGSSSRIVAGNAEYNLQRESLGTPLMIAAGVVPIERSLSLPEDFTPVSDIIMFGPSDQKINRSATVTFFLNEVDQTMSIYELYKGEWRNIGTEIIENSLQAKTNSLGQFIVLSGIHGDLYRDLIIPKHYTLFQNYPNPFNPSTNFAFDLPEQGYVTLVVYDIMGKEIARIFDGDLSGGYYKFNWDGRQRFGAMPSSGVYFFQLTANDFQQTKKMLIIK